MAVTASTPNYRFVRGTFDTTRVFIASGTIVNPGDLIYSSGGQGYLGSTAPWSGSLTTTQGANILNFVGVSLDQTTSMPPVSSGQFILVGTRGVYQYPCVALSGGPYDVGSYVGPDKDTGNNMLDQQVVYTASGQTNAVGKLAQFAPTGSTTVLVNIQGYLPFVNI